jgi:carbonic anhydrase
MPNRNEALRKNLAPADVLDMLKAGNVRFVKNERVSQNLLEQVADTRDGQWPLAVILSCIDSRTSVELIFDLGIGDAFSARIAGNIVNDDILGSMEFACKLAGAKLIVVMGHSKCGAVKGACDHAQMGNLTTLLAKIAPAVEHEKTTIDLNDRTSKNAAFVQKVADINVQLNVEAIMARSPILAEMVANKEIAIVGAMHDLDTGVVHFSGNTPFA